ncbi:MAG: hypothetical protein ACC683_11055 [Acidimicrobiia bacterium]
MDRVSGRSRAITAGLAVGAVLLAILATLLVLDMTLAAGNQFPIASDPPQYADISASILDGAIPYLDLPVEHLPGSLVPMVAVGFVSRVTGLNFETLWPFVMGLAFVATVAVTDSFPTRGHGGRRFLLLSLPLLPLVLFRVEPWLMLWVAASLSFAFRSAWGSHSAATAVAAVTKGWPLLLFAVPFRLGRRQLAATAGVLTILAIASIAILPGFREGRAFEGIHTETIVGNLVLVYRGAIASDLRLVGTAGAAYVSVGRWAVALNVLIGLPFLAIAMREVLRRDTVIELVRPIGLGVMGIILASPLFSPQFLFWLVPFVLFLMASRQRVFALVAVATLSTIVLWNPAVPGWNLLVLARNTMLVLLAVMWTLDTARPPTDSREDVS